MPSLFQHSPVLSVFSLLAVSLDYRVMVGHDTPAPGAAATAHHSDLLLFKVI